MKYLLENQDTERIIFRNIQLSDFNDWLGFHKNPINTKHWKADLKSPEIECKNWYKKQFNRYLNDMGGMNALIEKHTGKLIGHCGLLVQTVDEQLELEIGYSLLPEFWNRGFATEAAIKCRDYAFENNFSDSLISIISLTNKPSEQVAKKNGLKLDKRTFYNNNKVNIFRIYKSDWKQLKSLH